MNKEEPTFRQDHENFSQSELVKKLFREDYGKKKQCSAIEERKSLKRGLEAYTSPQRKRIKSTVQLVKNSNPNS